MKKHITLIGDSIFDNEAYVGVAGKPVIGYLREFIGDDSQATLLAQDGARMEDIYRQVEKLPVDSTHIYMSTGGNNLRQYLSFLEEPSGSVLEVLERLHQIREDFEKRYYRLLEYLHGRRLPIIVCTIYNCYFENEAIQRGVETALAVCNDAIIRSAHDLSIPYIELRNVCNEPSDFVQRIEPSDNGGRKIAKALS